MIAEYSSQIEALYLELYDKMIVYAESALGSRPLAEEAVQETFRIACQKPQSVCTSPNPQGWVFNALKFTIKSMRSNQASAKYLLDMYMFTQAEELTAAPDHVSVDVLYENVANTDDFQILKEMAIERRSHEEMAAKRGISVNACKKRVQRAKEKLQKKLKHCL